MLLARRNNNSDWLSNFFDDAFFNTLPEDADREKISAKVADGVLEVEIPKLAPKEEAKATKNIEVK